MSRHPITKWAQRSDKVFLTIELPDANDVKLSLKPEGHFNFSAKGADDLPYELDLELFDAVNVEESKAAVAPRTICYLIKKAESKWWPRLMKEEGKPPVFLKVDWDKWQDEDDEDVGFNDFGDMDFSKLGMGGADDDDIEDDDEDDVVESANKDGLTAVLDGSTFGAARNSHFAAYRFLSRAVPVMKKAARQRRARGRKLQQQLQRKGSHEKLSDFAQHHR